MSVPNLKTLILNADWFPYKIRSWQDAFTMEVRGKVSVIDFYSEYKAKDGKGRCYPIPAVACLKKYIHLNHNKASFSPSNVIMRDRNICQYCGVRFASHELNLDHVVPKSMGGRRIWTNIVTSCIRCNRMKGDQTCEKSGMFPIKTPVQPSYNEVFQGLSKSPPEEWMPYLSVLPTFKEVMSVYD